MSPEEPPSLFGAPEQPATPAAMTAEMCIRDRLYVCEGSDYEKIYTSDLAEQRDRYEIYNHTNLQQNLEITMLIVPWLDVNQKIEYHSKNTDSVNPYIIKSISGSTSDATMQVSLVRFYPEYAEI